MKSARSEALFVIGFFILSSVCLFAGDQPVAIFHAFDQSYRDVGLYVCELAGQGYSHVQIVPAQRSKSIDAWYGRYQPVDYTVIEGKRSGSETDLKTLVDTAHRCGIKVIADVVFNHMADVSDMPEYSELNFPGLSKEDFNPPCGRLIDYNDRNSVVNCALGNDVNRLLPDLDQTRETVQNIHRNHIKTLLTLGVDGFRFDAAKHMPPHVVKSYVDFIDRESNNRTWNYLEVIEDQGTSAEDYRWIAAVTDFVLYKESLLKAFSFDGNLRSLRVPVAVNDPRSVTFGRNHDTVPQNNDNCIVGCYGDPTDSYLATTYVLAREQGTPIILNWDNYDSPYIRYGVKFRRIMKQREAEGKNVKEHVLAAIDNSNVLMMERGNEGFYVVNKGLHRFDVEVLDLTQSLLEGCYRELRRDFTAAIERRQEGKKYVTRWGRWERGGIEIYGREALFFVRDRWEHCHGR